MTRTLAALTLLLAACSGGAPAPEAPAGAPVEPVAVAPQAPEVTDDKELIPFGDPWEFCADINDFRITTPNGQVTLGYVLVPSTSRENGRFLPGHQYWLRLNASAPLPANFNLQKLQGQAPQSALDRTDWEKQDNSLFDSQDSASFSPITLGSGEQFYEVKVKLDGEIERAAFVYRELPGGPPQHTWFGEEDGLVVEPANPLLRVVKTEDVVRFISASQPATGYTYLKTEDP